MFAIPPIPVVSSLRPKARKQLRTYEVPVSINLRTRTATFAVVIVSSNTSQGATLSSGDLHREK